MHWPQTTESIALALGAAISVLLAGMAWSRRPAPGAVPAVFLLIGAAIWQCCYGFELTSLTLAEKIFWIKVEYLGIFLITPSWLLCIFQYVGRAEWRRAPAYLFSCGLNVGLAVAVWTLDHHHLFYQQIKLLPLDGGNTLQITHGPLFWLHVANSYALTLFGLGLCLQSLRRSSALYRTQTLLLIFGAIAPWLSSLLYILSFLLTWRMFDITPFGFLISGITTVLALSRHKLFDITPVARNAVFDNMQDGVLVLDDQGRIADMNRACQSLTGCEVNAVVGHAFQLVCPEWPTLPALQPESAELHLEWQHMVTEQLRIFDLVLSPLPSRDGRSTGVLVVIHDITELRHLAYQRQRAEKLESLGVLAGGIAHDFNNLLTAILGNISLAAVMLPANHPATQRLQDAETAATRASSLTHQLLTFARGGAPVRKAAHLADVIRDTVTFTLTGSAVRHHFDLAHPLWPVFIDEGQISQVISNLVLNAVQAMPQGGTVTVRAENVTLTSGSHLALPPGAYVRFAISDTGMGIAPEHLARIFDPYFTTKTDGSGLGLSVCYAVVQNHGGEILVDATPGVGATFTVLLPAMPEVEIPMSTITPTILPTPPGKRLLIMDDDDAVREVLAESLVTLGYTVAEAADGDAMLEAYQQAQRVDKPFALVIMDLTIRGGKGGKEAMEELLVLDPAARAIVSSGYATDPIIANYRDYGFAGMVVKPYRLADLQAVIAQVLAA